MLGVVHQNLARPRTRRRAATGALLTLAGFGLVIGPAVAVPPSVSIAAKPSTGLLPTQQAVISGQASTTRVRPIELQYSATKNGTFSTIAEGQTKDGGAYSITDPESRTGYYRIDLPATNMNGGPAREVTSDPAQVYATAGLYNGQTLASGESVTSIGGKYELDMQKNGNLRMFAVATPHDTIWQSATTNSSGAKGARLVMQYRGNLVLVSKANNVLWSTGTADKTASLYLTAGGRLLVRNAKGDMLWNRTSGLTQTEPGSSTAALRGNSWVDAKVPYSQSRYYSNKYGRYRTDCSGFVSMMWDLPTSYTTRTIPSISTVIKKADLKSGDVLNAYDYHVVLFDGWANDAHTQYYAYEETPSTGAARHVIPYPYWSSSRPGSFVPRRLNAGVANSRYSAAYLAKMSRGGDAGPTNLPYGK